ncbi:MAG: hypothetical protein LBV45_02570 [Xanthomonadaceae bacterium]|jgi:hypothetical protein|nr:hypothetical protein [Xanthomonadaceae bacterium]
MDVHSVNAAFPDTRPEEIAVRGMVSRIVSALPLIAWGHDCGFPYGIRVLPRIRENVYRRAVFIAAWSMAIASERARARMGAACGLDEPMALLMRVRKHAA